MPKEFDFLVFGVTGYTGQFVAEEIAETCRDKPHLKWAVAGRNMNKINAALEEAAKNTGIPSIRDVPIIIADISSEKSLLDMAESAKVVLNCVGPFNLYGEPVIRACIERGAHHLDISGEPYFLERIQLKYNQMAKQSKVFVIGACGGDSVPADIGVQYTETEFRGRLNEIESFLQFNTQPDVSYPINSGTWKTIIESMRTKTDLKSIRRQLYPSNPTKREHKQKSLGVLFFSRLANSWCVPFPGSDKSVVYRSQRYLLDKEQKGLTCQYAPYACMKSFGQALSLLVGVVILLVLAKIPGLANYMKEHPDRFTFGAFTKRGVKKDILKKAHFEITFKGRGWKENQSTEQSPTSEIVTKMSGPEFGYLACSTFIVQAAVCLVEEIEKFPDSGGVLTPAVALAKTSYIGRLKSRGIKFETIVKHD